MRALKVLFVGSGSINEGTHRIFFNNYPEVLKQSPGFQVSVDDHDVEKVWDMIIMVSSDQRLVAIRERFPLAKIGVLKPQYLRDFNPSNLQFVDFLIAGSSFERDLLLPLERPVLVLPHYEQFNFSESSQYLGPFSEARPAKIVYHGNKHHLEQLAGGINGVLERINREVPIEITALYDIKSLGQWQLGRPSRVKVHDIQWSIDSVEEQLSGADIGIVPNYSDPKNDGILKLAHRLYESLAGGWYGSMINDHFFRLKSTANAGRATVFMQAGVPVVADSIPEICQIFGEDKRGLAVSSVLGWELALRRLLQDSALRGSLRDSAYEWCNRYFDHEALSGRVTDFYNQFFKASS